MRYPVLLCFGLIAAFGPADAADRHYSVIGFDRLRVEGPFDVEVETGRPASGTASSDPRTLEQLAFDNEGSTLIVRLNGVNGWAERGGGGARSAPVVHLTTPQLRSVLVRSGGRVRIAGGRVDRFDAAINGAGSINARGLHADQLVATLIGSGEMTLAGEARFSRLLLNGAGTIDGTALQSGDLNVRIEGTGETRAAARYTATVTTTGLGRAVISGNPRCKVHALGGGPILCDGPHD